VMADAYKIDIDGRPGRGLILRGFDQRCPHVWVLSAYSRSQQRAALPFRNSDSTELDRQGAGRRRFRRGGRRRNRK
jgi:hypothetical protein